MNTDSNQDQAAQIEAFVKRGRFLWLALFASIGLYYGLTVFVGRAEEREPNNTLFFGLLGIAMSTTLLSFIIKSKQLNEAITQRNVQMVLQAYILTLAITEVGALLGVLVFFTAQSPYYFVFFIIAACAYLLHFPRREHFESASFKGMSM
jgi:hypothetical protein